MLNNCLLLAILTVIITCCKCMIGFQFVKLLKYRKFVTTVALQHFTFMSNYSCIRSQKCSSLLVDLLASFFHKVQVCWIYVAFIVMVKIKSSLLIAWQEIDVEVFEGLSRLRVLNLRDNTLTSLPEEISAFQLLARLDLTNNHLTM